MLARAELAAARLNSLLTAMEGDTLAPDANVRALREGLAEHYKSDRYLLCTSMGALVRENIQMLRHYLGVGLGSLSTNVITQVPPGS